MACALMVRLLQCRTTKLDRPHALITRELVSWHAVEMTRGEETALVKELERAFSACKQVGLLVMVTTSHSAPFASSGVAKQLLIDSWVRDENIDLFSPQLYTSGTEGKPEFLLTPCGANATEHWKCSWERLVPMKAKWVLSLASGDHYPEAKAFFNKLDIEPIGYIQWKEPTKPSDSSGLHIAVGTSSPLPRPRERPREYSSRP